MLCLCLCRPQAMMGIHAHMRAHKRFQAPPAGLEPPSSSLVTLEQNLLPRGGVPAGMRGMIRGMCAKQLKDMIDDLAAELVRRQKARGKGESPPGVLSLYLYRPGLYRGFMSWGDVVGGSRGGMLWGYVAEL
jgi:hypothetical protein